MSQGTQSRSHHAETKQVSGQCPNEIDVHIFEFQGWETRYKWNKLTVTQDHVQVNQFYCEILIQLTTSHRTKCDRFSQDVQNYNSNSVIMVTNIDSWKPFLPRWKNNDFICFSKNPNHIVGFTNDVRPSGVINRFGKVATRGLWEHISGSLLYLLFWSLFLFPEPTTRLHLTCLSYSNCLKLIFSQFPTFF